ncbi:MAG: translocase FtsK protein [Parcubacteria group bacterium GW2011_GWC1_43_12]|nr:MAG: translocase FtsK protein [Parcubacteria group bacterium GW2011_GWC1_43_12]
MPKKFKNEPKNKNLKLDLEDDTKKGIVAVILFLLAIIVILSYFGLASTLGNYIHKGLDSLFGWGYFLVPLGLILAGVSIIKSLHKDIYGTPFFGMILFILSFLGILEMIFGSGKGGGYLGLGVAYPFTKLLGNFASYIILFALVLISLLIIFNISLKILFLKILGKEEKEKKSEFIKDAQNGKKEFAQNDSSPFGSLVKKFMSSPDFEVKGLNEKQVAKAQKTEEKPVKKDDLMLLQSKMVLEDYQVPPLEMLEADSGEPTSGDIKANANIIKRTLQHFNIDVEMAEVNIGPTVTQYTLRPAQGVKLSKITALSSDLSLSLAAHPIRIEAPIPGRSLVGIEIPNKSVTKVRLRNLADQPEFSQENRMLTLALGRDVAGVPAFAALEKMPHMLIAGATGTGKSVCLNSLILSMLCRHAPNFLKIILIDPKRVEFPIYNGLPHLLTPVIVESQKAINALRWAVGEMERRFETLSNEQVRDILSYNKKFAEGKVDEPLPYIVIIIDELADLMASHGRDMEAAIVRLAQMARAVGIHLVLATQRPSVEVITGLIKANITTRVAFQVASQTDSRTILDAGGAEKLLGNGDMLFLSGDSSKARRIQGAFVSEKEVKKVVDFITKQTKDVHYADEVVQSHSAGRMGMMNDGGDNAGVDDDLYEDAKQVVIQTRKASASLLQRRLRVGYARAARLIDMLEENGIVGPGEGAKPREVLVEDDEVEDIPGNPIKASERDVMGEY